MADPFYITTAISYPNGKPHIGHAYEAIAADVIARFQRLSGRDVRFQTGTDEHGLKMAQKARELGVTPQQLADEMSQHFIDMCDALNVSYDVFMRTTEPRHHAATQELWRRMEANAGASEGAGASSGGQPVRQFKMAWIGALFLVVALLALLIGRGLRHGGDATATTARPGTSAASAAPVAAAAPAPAPSADSPALEQARQMVARGEIDPAIALLNQERTRQPDNADVPYLLAMIYFDNRRWPDGLAAAQIAVKKSPALKSDPDLIKGAIRSLVSDRGYDRSQAFLRSLGQPAMPFIKEAAARDASPKVRERAAELVGNGGGRGWGSRPATSGGSMFHR